MKLSSECICCVVTSALELMEKQLPPEAHEITVGKILAVAGKQNWHISPPEFAGKLYNCLKEAGGKSDSFAEAKKRSTAMALQLLPEMRAIIAGEADEFAGIVKAVIGGNIIDCGADRSIDIESAIPQLKEVFKMPLDENIVLAFKKCFYQAESIFYVLDNCGEAVFDRLLLEKFPGRVTLGVRGDFILNDITRHELADSGLGEYDFVDTGDSTPGVSLRNARREFIERMRAADLVIAKGQGNYETLDGYDRPSAHLLRVKCPAVARSLAMPRGALALQMRNI